MLSQKALAATAAAQPVYVEDVFSTYLYTGTGSNFYINNGIDVNGEGGLALIKGRSQAAANPATDAGRWFAFSKQSGSSNELAFYDGATATTNAATTETAPLWFSSSGLLISGSAINTSSQTYASWTFRKAEKFFDVVTYTGNGSNPRNISHSLGSVPGCIIVKKTNDAGGWTTYHRMLNGGTNPQNYFVGLDETTAEAVDTGGQRWGGTAPTSTVFTVGSINNNNGDTYVAYLFAHDAGGFGDDESANVITCGGYTGNGAATGPQITLGYEPQWLLIKKRSGGANWYLFDNMRVMAVNGGDPYLNPNQSSAETGGTTNYFDINATGFQLKTTNGDFNGNGATYIYIAIRRGPMKTPEVGTSVFNPVAQASYNAWTNGFVTDLQMAAIRSGDQENFIYTTRLTGYRKLITSSQTVEANDNQVYWTLQNNMQYLWTNSPAIYYSFGRAPGFLDVVCYTGTGSATTINHSLGVAPEFLIVKNRTSSAGWYVYHASLGATKYAQLDARAAAGTAQTWNNTAPTSSVFSIGDSGSGVNTLDNNYVAFMFATIPGVSKVGSYTGTGAALDINCGFTTGARFVLVKQTDNIGTAPEGGWWVFDSARGIVSGNDPRLAFNLTSAEVTNVDFVNTYSSGFSLTSNAEVNESGSTYIYLAIA